MVTLIGLRCLIEKMSSATAWPRQRGKVVGAATKLPKATAFVRIATFAQYSARRQAETRPSNLGFSSAILNIMNSLSHRLIGLTPFIDSHGMGPRAMGRGRLPYAFEEKAMGAPLTVPRRLLSIAEFHRIGEAEVLGEDELCRFKIPLHCHCTTSGNLILHC